MTLRRPCLQRWTGSDAKSIMGPLNDQVNPCLRPGQCESMLNVSCGVRTHAQLPAVDLKSTPLTTRANWLLRNEEAADIQPEPEGPKSFWWKWGMCMQLPSASLTGQSELFDELISWRRDVHNFFKHHARWHAGCDNHIILWSGVLELRLL